MKRLTLALTALTCLITIQSFTHAADVKPLRALLITGGGYHDYQTQKKILTEGISARANVEWTVVLENPKPGDFPQVFAKKDWIKGYDVIVHNQCFAKYSDDAGVDKIVKEHLDAGVGVVMIHCAMHAFRDSKTKEWDKLVGVESRRHGAKFPIVVKNLGPDHPITGKLAGTWTTPQGELYHTSILPSATKLGVGFKDGEENKSTQVCIWTNQYEKCRVFGTTLGHHNETMQEKGYLDLVSNGVLWACGKLDDSGKARPGYAAVSSRPAKVRFKVFLANGQERDFANPEQLARSGLVIATVPCCGN